MGGRVKLTVVGCSGSFPGPWSAASCYLVEAPHREGIFRLVLDLGSGAFGPLQRYIDPLDISAVALSHLHADHCLDLTAMYVHRTYHRDAPHRRVDVYGPPGTGARLARGYDMPEHPGMGTAFNFHSWERGGTHRIGPFELTVARVTHPVESYAIRVQHEARSLVYSGDTGPDERLVSLARGADVLVAEATFLDGGNNPPDLHLTGREAAEHATRAGAGRLLLTHIPPWTDPADVLAEAKPAFAGPLEVVEPGATYDI